MILVLAGWIFLIAAITHCSTMGISLDHGDIIITIVILLSATGIASLLVDIKIRLTEIRDTLKNTKG